MVEIEMVDDLTNNIMDIIRKKFKLKEDSDEDDALYGELHNVVIKYELKKLGEIF